MMGISQEKELSIIKDLKRKQKAKETINGARKEMMRVKNLYLREIERLEGIEAKKRRELKNLTIKSMTNKYNVGHHTIRRVEREILTGEA